MAPLGRGAYSTVYKVKSRTTGNIYALKVVGKNKVNQAKITKRIINEIQLQSQINHENVVKLIQSFEDDINYYLVLELCSGGDLFSYIKCEGKLSEEEARRICGQIVEAICCLHSQNILHRDLKLGNILMSEDRTCVKVADFGLAVQLTDLEEERNTLCGTPNYICPEIVSRKPYGLSSDLWSLGCIIYACLIGSPPFESPNIQSTLLKVKGKEFNLPKQLSLIAVDLITSLLSYDPRTRLNIFQVREHRFFSQPKKRIPSLFTHSLSPIPRKINECEYFESMESSRFVPSQNYLLYSNSKKSFSCANKENIYTDNMEKANKTESFPPLSTQNLKPFVHKLTNGELEITDEGWVRVQIGKRKLEISGDGMMVIYQGKIIDIKAMKKAPAKLYKLGIKFLEVVKSKTPRIIIEEQGAKCMLMRNFPFPNFEADFLDGTRVTYQVGSEIFTVFTLNGQKIEVNPYVGISSQEFKLSRILEISMEGLKKCLRQERDII